MTLFQNVFIFIGNREDTAQIIFMEKIISFITFKIFHVDNITFVG